MRTLPAALTAALLLTSCATIRTPLRMPRSSDVASDAPRVRRVVLIILENGNPVEAAKQPFLVERAKEGMVLEQYHGVAHPSQPNYIAIASGSLAGTSGNSMVTLDRPNLGTLLPNRWKVYAEDYPAPSDLAACNFVTSDGQYVRRHVPFLSFRDVDCRGVVRLNADVTPRTPSATLPPPRDPMAVTKALRDDIRNGTLPDFAMIIPNLTDQGHDPSNMANANDWLTRYIAPLLSDPAFTTDTVFMLTFDEDEHRTASHPNRVFMVLWGDHVKQGTNDDVYDHEDLYLTIAAVLGVTPLPATEEKGARPFGGIWR